MDGNASQAGANLHARKCFPTNAFGLGRIGHATLQTEVTCRLWGPYAQTWRKLNVALLGNAALGNATDQT
jgi:hypothetical protein